jgi:hypothetical protein
MAKDTPNVPVQDSSANYSVSSVGVGSVGDNGKEIVAVIAKSQLFVVYKTTDGKIGFDATPEFMSKKKNVINRYDELSIQITYALPDKHKRFVYDRLGYALANNFVMFDGDDVSPFLVVEKCIEDIADDYFQFYYVTSSFYILVLFFAVFFAVHMYVAGDIHDIARSSCMGALGAFLSVLTRSRKLRADGFVSIRYSITQGTLRTVIGGLFGFLSFILIKSNFVLGAFSDNTYHVLLVATFAGFNERFVPEALKYTKE